MKKILIIIPSLGMGGMERMLVNISNAWCRCGHEVTVFNQTHHCDYLVAELDKKIKYFSQVEPMKWIFHATLADFVHGRVRFLPHKLWILFHTGKYLHKKYIKEKFDVEVAFFSGDPIKIVSGSSPYENKKIIWLHSERLFIKNNNKAKWYINKFNNIVCVSKTIAQKFIKAYGFEEKVSVIYNLNKIDNIKSCAREPLEPKKNTFTIISVARLYNKQKGFDRLLDVVKMLNMESIDYELWIVGDGIDKKNIEKKIEDEKLINVRLFGYQDNPYKFINASDLFVCPSRFEGFCLVVAEAIILGVPVVSTDCAGPNEILENGEYGILCENSTAGLYNSIKRIIGDKKLYEHFKQKAFERQGFFSEEHIMKQLNELLSSKQT